MKMIPKHLLCLFSGMVFCLIILGCNNNISGEKIVFDDGISSNARLSNLILSEGELNYSFSPYDWIYEASVPSGVDSITVTAMVEHPRAAIEINGVNVESGMASDPIPLSIGANAVNILVTAWDGTENLYTVTVKRLISNNANLSSLEIVDNNGSPGNPADDTPLSLKENFNTNTLEYSAIVAGTVNYIAIHLTAEEGSVDVQKAGSGIGTLDNIELSQGLNRFLITVTALDMTTKKYYTLSITKLTGTIDNGKVTGFVIQSVSLNPAYRYENYPSWGSGIAYESDAEIAIGKMAGDTPAAKLSVTTESSAAQATITINGESTEVTGVLTAGSLDFNLKARPLSGSAYAAGSFEGFQVDTAYEMIVIVTSGDGTTHSSTFTVNIQVTSGSSNADLYSLRLFWGSNNSERVIYPGTFTHDATYHNPQVYVTGAIDPAKTEYVAVVYSAENVRIAAQTADTNAKYVRFNGVDGALQDGAYSYQAVLAKGGVTAVAIEVMPESGKAAQVKTYTIRIKLLNAHEMFWAIYGPANYKSFARWEALFGTQGLKTVNIPGVISGNLKWEVTLSGLQPLNTMTWVQYLDGNRDSGGYSLRTDYNDNHPANNNLHGFILNGSVSGLLDGILTKNGTITGAFDLYSPWGDMIGTVTNHYTVVSGVKVEGSDSYADFEYMGETVRVLYRDNNDGNSLNTPYPFSETYIWEDSWNPGTY